MTLHLGYFIYEEEGWENDGAPDPDDDTFITAQATYGQNLGDMKLKAAIGIVDIDDESNSYTSDKHTAVSVQLKGGNWRVAVDYVKGDPENAGAFDGEDTATMVQGRYKLNDMFGLRIYRYDVEAFSVPGDGEWSQDNFPNPGSTGVSNFDGMRYQVDIKLASNVALDLRYYDMDVINENMTGAESDAILTDDRERIQLNLNVKF